MLKGIISAVFLAVACTFLYGQQPSITTFLKEGAPVEVIPGMFTTYRSDKHIYWEIPEHHYWLYQIKCRMIPVYCSRK